MHIVVDRIIQDKPHFIDGLELEVQKAEDLTRSRRPSLSRSASSRSSRSPVRSLPINNNNNNNNNKRSRRETPSPQPIPIKRPIRNTDELTMRQLEEENRRLHEHLIVSKRHFDEDIWKLRRELDEERRRYDQLKVEYEYVRRDLAHVTTELQQKTSTRHLNSNTKRDLSSRR
ncbi:unnamed protein product [Rotaria sp. Silwood2]|nr:unnamed protein product [Rotaria sp. Silwood2]